MKLDIPSRNSRAQYWVETASPALEGRLATQYAVANGLVGVRGTYEEMPSWASPGFYVAGTYCAGPRAMIPIHSADHILTHPERVKPEHHAEYSELTTMPNLPNPVVVRLFIGEEQIDLNRVAILSCERLMHMEEARVTRRLVIRDGAGRRTIIDSERFASWDNPRLVCFRYQVTADGYAVPIRVEPYIDTEVGNVGGKFRLFEVAEEGQEAGCNRVIARLQSPAQQVAIVQRYCTTIEGGSTTVEVTIGVSTGDRREAELAAQAGFADGYEACREAHVHAVKRANERVGASIEADLLSEQGFNFGLMQLEMALCRDTDTVSVPIKGLTGEGYRFMVFWDTDFHLFPYYLLTNPAQARNLLLYRYRLLDAARENARAWGYLGAQVPWETGTSGTEETAPWLNLQDRELHMSADVAYAVKLYDDLTNDADLLVRYGAEIVFETARFYASRVVWNGDAGRYELRDIGCPDQYHTFADDNVFISRMAQWNLAYAAELATDPRLAGVRTEIGLTDDEVADFRRISDTFYIIQPNEDGIIEEFDGFFKLSTDLRGISESFCAHTQAVKQPDTLVLFLPFGDDYSEEVQRANWRFYAARTLHGSSLSLPGMALAAARAGLLDEGLEYFQRSARMDLDDVNLNTNLGVHLAGYSVLWETAVLGYGGLTPRRDRLDISPRLPAAWGRISYAVHWRGCRVQVNLSHERLRISADPGNPRAVPVHVYDTDHAVQPGEEYRVASQQPVPAR